MESLALLIVLMLGVVFLLPWFIFITLKILNHFKAPKVLMVAIFLISILEFVGWLIIYINLLLTVRLFMFLFLLLALVGVFFSYKEAKNIFGKYF
jgi:hypothetical protein